MKVFGIGCIYFGYKESGSLPKDFLDPSAFLATVKDQLEGVENISNVTIHGSDSMHCGMAIIDEDDGDILVPLPQYGVKIGFDLYLPFRVQETVYERIDVEAVHVDILYGYEMPATIVSYDWPDEEGDASPSMSVVVVRKYLERKLSSAEFVCGSVGPSPFHADFILRESQLEDRIGIDDVSKNRLGYASIELVCPRGTSLIEAFCKANLDTVIPSYYNMSNIRSRIIESQNIIAGSARNLLENDNRLNLLSAFKDFIKQADKINTLNAEIFKESLLRLDMANEIAEADHSEIIGGEKPLERFFVGFRKMAAQENWSKFSDIAKFFEERRQKLIGNMTAIFSGIMGGLVGAIIGSLATYFLTQPPKTPTPPPQPPAPAAAQDTAP